jgi:hypothetical protein
MSLIEAYRIARGWFALYLFRFCWHHFGWW